MRKKVENGNTAGLPIQTTQLTTSYLRGYGTTIQTRYSDKSAYTDDAKNVVQGSDISSARKTTDISRRLGRTIEADLERHMKKAHHRLRFCWEGCTPKMSVEIREIREIIVSFRREEIWKSFCPYTFSQISHLEILYRSRRPRQILQTCVDIGSAAHHQLPGGDVNALVSKINFENMANKIWKGRWDGRGRDLSQTG